MHVDELPTPALWADLDVLESNLAVMAQRLPGNQLRPHVKAHKTTALARVQYEKGHTGFTCATPREVLGLAQVGLGDDLLLANETVDAGRLEAMARSGARVTVAVDSEATVDAAAAAGEAHGARLDQRFAKRDSIHVQHGLDDAGLGLEPVADFTDKIVVAGVVGQPRAEF